MAPGILQAVRSPGQHPSEEQVLRHSPSPNGEVSASLSRLQMPRASTPQCQVCVVGAGPAGLMLACNLARFGIDVQVIDERDGKTTVGRADGLQPKTIETFRQMRLADTLLQRGVKVYDISFWRSTPTEKLHRLGREVHYPPVIDVLDPCILLAHQGMVEDLFMDDMRLRNKEVLRNVSFESYEQLPTRVGNSSLQVNYKGVGNDESQPLLAQYLVGCDGAHSRVRKAIPGVEAVGVSQPAIWGVLDGELITDFPDIWSKTLVYSEVHGSILIVPRERNMTRLYIELKSCQSPTALADLARGDDLGQSFVMEQARKIMAPFNIDWSCIEWFGRYQVGQRLASRFSDESASVFLAGDASHTHSPKSAQGMNTAMHDSWNLAWKLNLAARGFARPELMASYEEERRKVALDLVNFDYEHANQIANGDAVALAKNFLFNVRFISGIGAEYGPSILTQPYAIHEEAAFPCPEAARPGSILPPAKVTRYIDANPVDIQLDIPMMGQFRIYLFAWDVFQSATFLESFCNSVSSRTSFVNALSAAATASYARQPRPSVPEDVYTRPERYVKASELFTFALITSMPKSEFEISDLPPLLQENRWTLYLDNVPAQDTRGARCTDKWLGRLAPGEVAIINVRPDGYVGSIGRWDAGLDESGANAAKWLDDYYGGFLKLPDEPSK
ncbi:Phenol 2-monooxygenase [Beauveria bassiana D1-5]|nr:Phenol 2-monooxygenase [Beauveria bassiana D1-5]